MPGTKIRSDNLQPVYQGSVKRVFGSDKQPDRLWFEFSDDYSVFDWGKMPDTIADKGRALTVLGAYFFEELARPERWQQLKQSASLTRLDQRWVSQILSSSAYTLLCKNGLSSHFYRLCTEGGQALSLTAAATCQGGVLMEVERAQVFHPTPTVLLGQPVYYYAPLPAGTASAAPRLVPLEVVFRFGMPAGSSLKERLENNPDYARQLGLPKIPADNAFFDRPIIEFFTKLEPKDRLLTLSEALGISTLNPEQFQTLSDQAQLIALALNELFAAKNIELWDGKFEFIFDGSNILLADSIGPDELRLMHRNLQLSKEMIRQVYRGSEWELNLKKAQKLAAQRGSLEWKSICRDELQSHPQSLPPEFKRKIDRLYPVLANHVSGQSLFAGQPSFEAFAQSLTAGDK